MKKTKQQLIESANIVAEEHQFKKNVIEKMLDDLDQLKALTSEHLEAMSTIQELLTEMDDLEAKHQDIIKQIKG